MATLRVIDRTSSSLTVEAYNFDTAGYDRRLWWTCPGSTTSYSDVVTDNDLSPISHTFRGLSPSTTYTISVDVFKIDPSEHVTTLTIDGTTSSSITKWEWPSDVQYALENRGKINIFTYSLWNDLCDKIVQVRTADNVGTWDTAGGIYLSYANTCMSSSDKTLTAARFNSMKYQIGSQESTGILDVSVGDTVKGSDFITITNALNRWIDRL